MHESDKILLEIVNHIISEKEYLLPAIKNLVETKNIQIQNNRPAELIFKEIYNSSLWGKSDNPQYPFFSGTGSHDENVSSIYIQSLRKILKEFNHKPNVVDLGCGDFHIGSHLRDLCKTYIACDIVPELIKYNSEKYQDMLVDFQVINLIDDCLPSGEIAFLRQVLQHLSNGQIEKILAKLKSNYKTLILTEHLPKSLSFSPNIDKLPGHNIRLDYNSGIMITKPPFNFLPINEKMICEVEVANGRIVTYEYELNY